MDNTGIHQLISGLYLNVGVYKKMREKIVDIEKKINCRVVMLF